MAKAADKLNRAAPWRFINVPGAGFTHWRADIDTLNYDDSRLGNASESDTEPSYGAGAQYNVERFSMRLEYQRLKFGEDDADLTVLGVTYSF